MTAKLVHIIPGQAITALAPDALYDVPVIIGAPKELVTHRELRNKYHTNRSIKTWATYFLLKALSTSGKIKRWTSQEGFLLQWLQCNDKTIRTLLSSLKQLQLASIDKDTKDISLVSYKEAAAILKIPYEGTYNVKFNPLLYAGKQVFQYLLRGDEMKESIAGQEKGYHYHLDKNPLLKNDLMLLLIKEGADKTKLQYNADYFRERHLQLQIRLFKEGSDILDHVFTRRADVNRSVKLIAAHHCYVSKQSVSYMKKRMYQLGLIDLKKITVESKVRSRLYVPDASAPNGRRDGYKWENFKKITLLRLCDQVTFKYDSDKPIPEQDKRTTRKAA